MSKIFADNAPKYWSRGFSVLPVKPGTKQPEPSIKGWQGYLASIPNEQKQQDWQAKFATSGIALLLGGNVGPDDVLVAIDIDDDRLVRVTEAVIGQPTAAKRGKKGVTFFVRMPHGTDSKGKLKSTVFSGAGGLGNIDMLAGGKITVLPPSIHPDTGQPYVWLDRSLLDIELEKLPLVDKPTANLLKLVVGSDEAAILIDGQTTHDAGLVLTAKLVRAGATDAQVTAIITALLPEKYSGNSLQELSGWLASAREQGFDEPSDEKSENLAAAIVGVALEQKIRLFHDADDVAYAHIPDPKGGITYRVGSGVFRKWLRNVAYRRLERITTTGPLNEAIATLDAKAAFQGELRKIYTRVGGDSDRIAIDLGRSDGSAVFISRSGWEIAPPEGLYFVRGAGFAPLPEPVRGDTIKHLQELLNLDDENFRLVLAFLINALKPNGPYFILLVEGEQGSGKSLFCQLIKDLIDPNTASRLRLPDNDRDLMIHAKEYWLLSYDNASSMKPEMSDALCSLATGGGIAVRKLYTDGDLHVMAYARPFVINGISGYANRPDLLERAIPIKLQPMPAERRRAESDLLAEFERLRPAILASLYDAVAEALKNYPDTQVRPGLRMADAARWVTAAEPAFELKGPSLVDTVIAVQQAQVADRANEDPLVIFIRRWLMLQPGGEFSGHLAELHAELTTEDQFQRTVPKSPSRLSNVLERLRPAMVAAGFTMEFGRDNRGRTIRLKSNRPSLAPARSRGGGVGGGTVPAGSQGEGEE